MIYGVKANITNNHANTKIVFHGYEISIAMDDSCGRMNKLGRTDIRVYKDDVDVSWQFNDGDSYIYGTAENLFSIMQKIALLQSQNNGACERCGSRPGVYDVTCPECDKRIAGLNDAGNAFLDIADKLRKG
jgi:DNA-directed RNA polymerase subunit RPC12/RpoP